MRTRGQGDKEMGRGGPGAGRVGSWEVGDVKERKLASMVLPVSISIAPKSRIINAFFRGTLKFWNTKAAKGSENRERGRRKDEG